MCLTKWMSEKHGAWTFFVNNTRIPWGIIFPLYTKWWLKVNDTTWYHMIPLPLPGLALFLFSQNLDDENGHQTLLCCRNQVTKSENQQFSKSHFQHFPTILGEFTMFHASYFSYFAMCPYTLQCTPQCFSYSSMTFHIDVHVLSPTFSDMPSMFLVFFLFPPWLSRRVLGGTAPGRWSSARGSDSRAIRRRNLWASAPMMGDFPNDGSPFESGYWLIHDKTEP